MPRALTTTPMVIVASYVILTALTFFAAACGSSSTPGPTGTMAASTPLADLAPTGKLRVAISPEPPFLAKKDAAGTFSGIAIDLGTDLAKKLGVTMVPTKYDTVDALLAARNDWDVAVVPSNDTIRSALDLTAAFMLVDHSYLVPADSKIKTIADADQPGMKIASVKGEGHTAALMGILKQAQIVLVDTENDGVAKLNSGEVDAYFSGVARLLPLASSVAGSHVIDGSAFTAKFAVGLSKGHDAGLAFLKQFVESERSSGAVTQAIAALGLPGGVTVAPSGS